MKNDLKELLKYNTEVHDLYKTLSRYNTLINTTKSKKFKIHYQSKYKEIEGELFKIQRKLNLSNKKNGGLNVITNNMLTMNEINKSFELNKI